MTEKTMLRRKQIREAAKSLFRRKGYPAASMRGLALELGMEAASLYSHVPSKEAILKSICFDLAADFFHAAESHDQGLSAAGKLRAAIDNHLQVMEKNEDAFFVFM